MASRMLFFCSLRGPAACASPALSSRLLLEHLKGSRLRAAIPPSRASAPGNLALPPCLLAQAGAAHRRLTWTGRRNGRATGMFRRSALVGAAPCMGHAAKQVSFRIDRFVAYNVWRCLIFAILSCAARAINTLKPRSRALCFCYPTRTRLTAARAVWRRQRSRTLATRARRAARTY